MERLTHERVNGIKMGYWSAATKEALVQKLAAYENTGYEPDEIRAAIEQAAKNSGTKTATIKTGPRRGDAAEMAIIELVK